MMPMSTSPVIRLEGVTKLYGGIAALQSADFELFPGWSPCSWSGKTAQASPPCVN